MKKRKLNIGEEQVIEGADRGASIVKDMSTWIAGVADLYYELPELERRAFHSRAVAVAQDIAERIGLDADLDAMEAVALVCTALGERGGLLQDMPEPAEPA